MPDAMAIRMAGVAKMYKIFPSRVDNFLDAIGLPRWGWRGRKRYKEFWALKGIDLDLPVGSRTGILGRNGAGKSTLLKLITGNIPATEGTVEVNGKIQALLDAGAGFHPEFTGYENIHASLTYQGLTTAEIEAAVEDIVDFTELGDFLAQPYRTYSSGMQARLAFATATAIKPEILIIDEMLGAGDAYFVGKSADRIRQLVDGGASVLLVSHSLDQIVKLCDRAIWIERGKIVCRGSSLEVVKEYERYIRFLDDERLKAKNRVAQDPGLHCSQRGETRDALDVQFTATAGSTCDICEVTLFKGEVAGAGVRVGDAQDVNTSHLAYVSLEGGHWSEPQESGGVLFRSVTDAGKGATSGTVVCRAFHLYPEERYRCRVGYRTRGAGEVSLTIRWNGTVHGHYILPKALTWGTHDVEVKPFSVAEAGGLDRGPVSTQASLGPTGEVRTVSRWPGEGSLAIQSVRLLNAEEKEQAVFEPDCELRVRIRFLAKAAGSYPVIPVAVLFRLDGVVVSTHIGPTMHLELNQGETRQADLDYGPIRLGNGSYVFSVALYRQLSSVGPTEVYDLLDRSYEFAVVGNPPLESGIIRHLATWSIR